MNRLDAKRIEEEVLVERMFKVETVLRKKIAELSNLIGEMQGRWETENMFGLAGFELDEKSEKPVLRKFNLFFDELEIYLQSFKQGFSRCGFKLKENFIEILEVENSFRDEEIDLIAKMISNGEIKDVEVEGGVNNQVKKVNILNEFLMIHADLCKILKLEILQQLEKMREEIFLNRKFFLIYLKRYLIDLKQKFEGDEKSFNTKAVDVMLILMFLTAPMKMDEEVYFLFKKFLNNSSQNLRSENQFDLKNKESETDECFVDKVKANVVERISSQIIGGIGEGEKG